jgi:integrase
MHPLSPDEVRRLLEAASGDRLEALYVLAINTGMRRGELLGLKWSDVDLEGGRLSIRRTLTRTDNGKRVALGAPKTKRSAAPSGLPRSPLKPSERTWIGSYGR